MNTQNISGEIPLSICDLKDLTLIDLKNNNLTGNFPTVLYNCTKLKSLDLSGNLFIGNLPNDINKLSSNLQHLDLGSNNFSGDIPISLAHLKGLITLHMDSNYFNGTFPIELGNLENLEELVLAYNPFSSMSLPKEFGNLKNLKYFWMTSCNLIGEIPQDFANLTRLEHIDLEGNDLVGEIPSGLFLLENMTYVYLYKNMLSGSLPSSIKAFNLTEIDLSENKLIGTIPEKFGNLSKLQILHLQQNNLHGSIPSCIGRLPSLLKLKLFKNRLSGILPSELGLHSKLEGIDVSDNAFTGQLPDQLCFGRKLQGVVAFNNYLNGSIPPSLGQCNTLLVVELYNNSLSGDIPRGMWSSSRMIHILLSNNHFSGQLPEKLAWNLTRVEISNNKFSRKIPKSVSSTWRNLSVFKASDNSITGTVPLDLTSLSQLSTLWLDGNQLTWSLPELDNLELSDNHLSGKIPSELGQLKFSSLNLSDNQLTGNIPYELDNRTVWSASAHIITAHIGWIGGIATLIIFSGITLYTSILLADCFRSPDPVIDQRNYTYMEEVRANLGRLSCIACAVVQYANLTRMCLNYTITASISMVAVHKSNCFHRKGHDAACKFSNNPYMIGLGIFEIFLSQIPNFHKLTWLPTVGAIMSFGYSSIGIGLALTRIVSGNGGRTTITGADIGIDVTTADKTWRMFRALGDIAFAYTFSQVLVEIQDTLKSTPAENKVMKKANTISVFTTTAFHMMRGCLGYAAFGNGAPGNMFTGFEFYEPFWLVDLANIFIVIHLAGAYQVFAQPIYIKVESWASENWPNSTFVKRNYPIKLGNKTIFSLNLLRLIGRTMFVILTTTLAKAMPFFNDILAFLGSLGFWPLTVNFQVKMYIAKNNIERGTVKWFMLQLLNILCLVVSLATAVGSIQGLRNTLGSSKPF
ncbi:unnamed protein product [Amaranthus hypochondriacus]